MFKKGFILQELLISLFLVALLFALVLSGSLTIPSNRDRSTQLEEVVNLAEEGVWDSEATTNQGLVHKKVTRGKYSVEYLE